MGRTNNHLVIMAGGVGSRFWPMSTEERPKQFIDVLGTGRTLLQLTVHDTSQYSSAAGGSQVDSKEIDAFHL